MHERLGGRARGIEAQRGGHRPDAVVGHGHEHQVGRVDHRLCVLDGRAAVDLRGQRPRRGRRAARHRHHGISGLREASCQAAAEAAGTDETETGNGRK